MRNTTHFAAGRALDVICLGRFAVDFYAQQIGARLEAVTSFAKYLGGSSANTAFGCARLGLKAGLISRIGDDALGHFLVETIAREGCDVSHVSTDPSRLTGAVVLGIKDRDTFPLIFMRENCADMAIAEADVEEAYIAKARALLITGTHLSTEYINRISTLALDRARKNDVRTVLDIDYRPVLWGLTKRGDGETRYVRSDNVTAHIQRMLPRFDLIIGTIEEFNIAGGSGDIMASLAAIRASTPATLAVKRGPLGCAVIEGAIPRSLDDAFNPNGEEVADLKDRYRRGAVGDVEVKQKLATALNTFLDPIRERRARFAGKMGLVRDALADGTDRARKAAQATMALVHEALDLRYLEKFRGQ